MSAPTGCSVTGGMAATCDFSAWSPPLYDSDFSPVPGTILVNLVNGVIPDSAFVGLTGNGGFSGTSQLNIECDMGTAAELTLLSDSLSSNLSWVQEVSIADCNNMQIADLAFSSLTSMTILSIMSVNFQSISSTALSGLSGLNTLYIYASFPTTGIPAGLFAGLTLLRELDMSRTTLNSIPAGLFDDLKNLQTLYLSQCGLVTLPSNVFLPLLSVSTLDVSSNSFHCDCSLQWLGAYLLDTGFTAVLCNTPASLSFYDLTRSVASLTCTESADSEFDWKLIATASAAGLGLVLAVVGLVAYLRNRRKINRLLREKDQEKPSRTTKTKVSDISHIAGNQRGNNVQTKRLEPETSRNAGKVSPFDGDRPTVRPKYGANPNWFDF